MSLLQQRCVVLLLVVCSFGMAEDPSADQMAVDAISHPDSLELSLWATSDQLANPVAFTFDDQGRMYVCETFRQSKGVEDNRGHMNWLDDDLAAESLEDRLAYFKKHLKEDVEKYTLEEDRITVLEDKNNDGRIDFQEFVGERGQDQDQDWIVSEKERFDTELDKDKDGSLDKPEMLDWLIPSNEDMAKEEVDHLFAGADDDHSDDLTFKEIIDHHDIFVGSEATSYGEHLKNIDRIADEL